MRNRAAGSVDAVLLHFQGEQALDDLFVNYVAKAHDQGARCGPAGPPGRLGRQVDIVPLTLEFQNSMGYDAYMLRQGYRGALLLGMSFSDPWMSVIGFDDLPLCRYTTPALTTVRQDRGEIGKSAFYALSSQIEHTPISTILLHAELVERASVGPAP